MIRLLLGLALLLTPVPLDAMTVRCEAGRSCSGTLTFTGVIVSSMALNVQAHDGVLVAEWSCSGSSECGEERDRTQMALYDRGLLAVVLTVDPSRDPAISASSLGGTFAWVGEASVRLASAEHRR